MLQVTASFPSGSGVTLLLNQSGRLKWFWGTSISNAAVRWQSWFISNWIKYRMYDIPWHNCFFFYKPTTPPHCRPAGPFVAPSAGRVPHHGAGQRATPRRGEDAAAAHAAAAGGEAAGAAAAKAAGHGTSQVGNGWKVMPHRFCWFKKCCSQAVGS